MIVDPVTLLVAHADNRIWVARDMIRGGGGWEPVILKNRIEYAARMSEAASELYALAATKVRR